MRHIPTEPTNPDSCENPDNLDSLSKILQIQLVCDLIFCHLSHSTVSSLRLVNKLWNSSASLYLKNLTIFKVLLQTKSPPNQNELDLKLQVGNYDPSPKSYTLISTSALQTHLKAHLRKEVWLSLVYNAPSENPCWGAFLSLLIPWFTRLSLEDGRHCDSSPLSLNSVFPNVEILSVGKIFQKFHGSFLNVRRVHFKSSYGHTLYDNTKSILEATPNVVKIFNFPLDYIHNLKDLPDVQSKVKSINWHKCPMTTDDDCLEKLISSSFSSTMKLERVKISIKKWSGSKSKSKINGNYRKCCEFFSKILKTGEKSIVHLELWPLDNPDLIRFEELSQLDTLVLVLTDLRRTKVKDHGFFPTTFQPANTFPGFKTLEIRGLSQKLWIVDTLLPPVLFSSQGVTLSALRRLKIRNEDNKSPTMDTFERIGQYFLQIRILDVGHHPLWLTTSLPIIWRIWSNLETLSIHIRGSSEKKSTLPQFCMDAAVTGIPEEKCEELRREEGREISEERVKGFQSQPGISDMKSLKQILITLENSYWKKPLFSRVSFDYGFGLLPELTVKFRIDGGKEIQMEMQRMLEPILPFIILDSSR